MIYYQDKHATIYNGDALIILKQMPNESVDMIITSPPYYGLRNYGVDGQIGLEKSFSNYLNKLLEITAELKRVLKNTGSLWWNMGDCYASSGNEKTRFWHGKNQGKHRLSKDEYSGRARVKNYQSKCLLLAPERLAMRMIDEQGWILRNKVHRCKQVLIKKENRTIGSVMPASVKDRFNETGELLFFFTKSKKYYCSLDAVRLPRADKFIGKQDAEMFGSPRARTQRTENKYSEIISGMAGKNIKHGISKKAQKLGLNSFEYSRLFPNPLGKNIPTYWQINPEPHSFKKELGVDTDHFAAFPEALCDIPIRFTCPADGIVLDPFAGSGTALVKAKKLGRKGIGIDLNPDYCEIAKRRLLKVIFKSDYLQSSLQFPSQ